MNALLNKLKNFARKFRYFFPSPTPVGMAEFDAWAKSILNTYGWPDNDSFRFALASMVINLKPSTKWVSKYYFARVVHSAASKQIAGEYFRELKQRQQAAAKAEQEAQKTKVEATTSLSVVANEQPG